MRYSMKLFKGIAISVFILLIGILLIGSSSKEKPILDESVISGYHLLLFDCDITSISDIVGEDRTGEYHVCSDRCENTKCVKVLTEHWSTITSKEWDDNFYDENKRMTSPTPSVIAVKRYLLMSKSEALITVKSIMDNYDSVIPPNDGNIYEQWTKGGYSVHEIGDKCWTNKNSFYRKGTKKGNQLTILFVKGTTIVQVAGGGSDTNPMDPLFVERIAQLVDNRLK